MSGTISLLRRALRLPLAPEPRPRDSGGERGFSLIEALVALAVLSIAVTAFLGAFSTGSRNLGRAEVRTTAERLARSQLEYTKTLPYVSATTTYTAIPVVPADFTITTNASPIPGFTNELQSLTITVAHHSKDILVLEGRKQNR